MQYLVAIDGSDVAWDALTYALDVTGAMGADLTVVHVVDPEVYDTGGSEPITGISDADDRLIIRNVDDAEAEGETLLEEAVARASTAGRDVETELLYGDPVVELTDYAEEHDVDGLVLGHRGRSERLQSLLGSVAKAVTERATVPVTVVH